MAGERVLFHRFFAGRNTSDDEPADVVILHGLFGSSANWQAVSKHLSENFNVYTVDQRNHGESFHDSSHTIADLSADLGGFLNHHSIKKPIILGHSMGGLAAMHFALKNSERLSGLIVADIAPRTYRLDYSNEFSALQIDLSEMKTRQQVDAAMQRYIESAELRQFLQMNLKRDGASFSWKVNTEALQNEKRTEFNPAESDSFAGPALFINGGLSDFVTAEDEQLIKRHFPGAERITLDGANHWLHHSAAVPFLGAVTSFIENLRPS